MSPASQVTVTASTVVSTTVTSDRMTVSFAVCTSQGETRWSIAAQIEPGCESAGRRLAQAIESLTGSSASWSRRAERARSCNGIGWTDQHRALIDLAVELARFGAEGWGDA